MINDARQYIWTQPLQMFWPGLALFITVMAFNMVGDALRDHWILIWSRSMPTDATAH